MIISPDRLKRLELGERFLRRNPYFYPRARRELEKLQRCDLPAIREWTERRLRKVLRAAMHTPYGRKVGGTEDPASWPILTKERMRAYPQEFVGRSLWLGTKAATSGTTGVPLTLLRSPQSVVFEQACIDGFMRQLGVDPATARIATMRGDVIGDAREAQPPLWRMDLGGRKLTYCSNRLSPATVHAYADKLEEFKPDILCAYPTSIENFCRFLRDAGRKVEVPRVLLSSEVFRRRAWDLVRDTLNCRLIDYYGQAERVACAYAEEQRQYRFLPGYAHVELIPYAEEGGENMYEIVGTALWNSAMPIVRYRTGDFIQLPPGADAQTIEAIAYGTQTFDGVIGRQNEVLLSPEGVRVTGVNQVARDVPHILRIQVIQETPGHIRILVLPSVGFNAEDEAMLKENTWVRVAPVIKFKVEVVDQLETTPSGKTPLVIHRPAVLEALRKIA